MQLQKWIFDAHFHIGAYGVQHFSGRDIRPIPEEMDHATLMDCERYLRQYGIQGGVVVPTYLERQQAAFEYNRLLLGSIGESERLWGGLWVSPLEEVHDELGWTLAQLPHPRIRALKMASNTWVPYGIHPSGWTSKVRANVERILDHAAEYQLIVHFHTGYLPGADPAHFDAFLKAYGTRARYQLVHMGEAIAPAFKFTPRFVEWLRSGYDVYTDTSIVPGFAPLWLLEELDRYSLGFDRVFFATDSPWGRFPSEYWKVEGMDIDPEIKKKVFWENAARAYGVGEMKRVD